MIGSVKIVLRRLKKMNEENNNKRREEKGKRLSSKLKDEKN
jgi:hypothetical protein